MIFVSVGSQLPFDRLITTIDEWAANHQDEAVFAQIGNSSFTPKHIEFCQTIDPVNYNKRIKDADIIIAHAGTGTIITALELGIPLLIMPRLAEKGEHRNNHQLATVKRFSNFSLIKIVDDEKQLLSTLDQMLKNKALNTDKVITTVSEELITTIKNFISE
jgi:UDP-N-acetylglucosamine transferase subunit ALG13